MNRSLPPIEKDHVWKLYQAKAEDFARERQHFGGEARYFAEIAARIPAGAAVLDLGCGAGVPIARFFIDYGFAYTGVDAAPAMIDICRATFPKGSWVVADMRRLALARHFDAIFAWDSFFHLPPDDQRRMFPVFARHAAPGAFLLFTSGPSAGEPIGDLYGEPLYHASLDEEEYRALLADNGFAVVSYAPEDPEIGGRTVWFARRDVARLMMRRRGR
jgi:trans-aconitate methyltransferase